MKFVSLFFVGFFLWSQTANAEINLTSESVVDGKISKIHACRQKGGKDKKRGKPNLGAVVPMPLPLIEP